jgi:hypothetical protein
MSTVRCREPTMLLMLSRGAVSRYHRPAHFTAMKAALAASAHVGVSECHAAPRIAKRTALPSPSPVWSPKRLGWGHSVGLFAAA